MQVSRVVDPVTQVEYVVPEYSTPEETLLREQRINSGTLPVLTVPCRGVLSALGDDEGGDVDPIALGLSASVIERLDAWMFLYKDSGIARAVMREQWERTGWELFEEVTRELWARARVVERFGDFLL